MFAITRTTRTYNGVTGEWSEPTISHVRTDLVDMAAAMDALRAEESEYLRIYPERARAGRITGDAFTWQAGLNWHNETRFYIAFQEA